MISAELKDEIITRLRPIAPRKIVLFGSHARGAQTQESDIDLYVVTNDEFIPRNWSEKNAIYLKVARQLQEFLRQHPTDLIAHTKKMHEKFVELNGSFAQEILHNGVVLYESD
jgi:predicted nucleotidyltransferase